MGNRAVIAWERFNCERLTEPETGKENGLLPAIYLHWNGGLESVAAFLDFTSVVCAGREELLLQKNLAEPRKGSLYPDFEAYSFARLVQVIGNYFEGNASLSVGITRSMAGGATDNGVWLCDGLKVIDQYYAEEKGWNGGFQTEFDSEYYHKVLNDVISANRAFFIDQEYNFSKKQIEEELAVITEPDYIPDYVRQVIERNKAKIKVAELQTA